MGREGFEAFCHAEHPRLVGMLSLYVGDARLAEEIAQDSLAIAWRDWRKVRSMSHPSAWLMRVALNRSNSLFRKRAAERRAAERIGEVAPTEEPDLASAVAVRSAVKSLPARQRTVVVLHFFLDLPFREVAQIMGAPEPTVKSLSRRAVATLRQHGQLSDLEEVSRVT